MEYTKLCQSFHVFSSCWSFSTGKNLQPKIYAVNFGNFTFTFTYYVHIFNTHLPRRYLIFSPIFTSLLHPSNILQKKNWKKIHLFYLSSLRDSSSLNWITNWSSKMRGEHRSVTKIYHKISRNLFRSIIVHITYAVCFFAINKQFLERCGLWWWNRAKIFNAREIN